MSYHQITPVERYTLAALRTQVPMPSCAAIARMMGRHPSTISREVKRNSARHDDAYRPSKAQERTNGRRSRSRRNSHFTASDWAMVEDRLREHLSPEQISGRLRREGLLEISHETIYKHIWSDKRRSGRKWPCRGNMDIRGQRQQGRWRSLPRRCRESLRHVGPGFCRRPTRRSLLGRSRQPRTGNQTIARGARRNIVTRQSMEPMGPSRTDRRPRRECVDPSCPGSGAA